MTTMTLPRSAVPPVPPVLPESAPFSPAQRAWLNGFFAGLLGGQTVEVFANATAAPVEEEAFPWHDAALPIAERLQLAEGKPAARVMMAAMAQLDCGTCGYLCQTYAEAIARGEEKDLAKCTPGGKETAKKLKELAATLTVSAAVATSAPAATFAASKNGSTFDRHHPYPARLLEARPLTQDGSQKDVRHIALDLGDSGLAYTVGDALGVYPENCPELVTDIIETLGVNADEEVPTPAGTPATLRDALLVHYQITHPTPGLVELLMNNAADASHAAGLKEMLEDDGPGIPEGVHVLDLLRQYASARPPIAELIEELAPLHPRLYSISSSPKAHAGQVHLTVGMVRYKNQHGRACKGVASTFLGERAAPGQKVRVFVHKAHAFALPAGGDTPIIMVGPGTGIAPFRAFLEERRATHAAGKNWLFFGDQQRATDFLYEDELQTALRDGLLTRLDTAFSRDQAEKVYVQHRMLERGAELWKWLEEGAHFYVCGDAKRMAADVDAALKKIIETQGGLSPDAAKSYAAALTKAKRYQRDVY